MRLLPNSVPVGQFQLRLISTEICTNPDAVKNWLYASIQLYKYAGMQVCNMQLCIKKRKGVIFSQSSHFVNQASNPKTSFTKVVELGVLFENV